MQSITIKFSSYYIYYMHLKSFNFLFYIAYPMSQI